MESSASWHVFKNLVLLVLSLVFLPADTAIAAGAYLWNKLSSRGPHDAATSAAAKSLPDPLERTTVLVTGVNMGKGLALARMFHRAGHRVIGADCHSFSLGRVTNSVDVYYRLPPPSDPSRSGVTDRYLDRLLEIVLQEQVDLWISVSDVNAAVQDATVKEIIEARTSAKAIQLGVQHIRQLHEKDAFMEHTQSLGLQIPDTAIVQDRDEVIQFLQNRGGLTQRPDGVQYIMKAIGVDDLARFDMRLLPMASEAATMERIRSIPFKQIPGLSFIIQEYISGPEYCTHALVIHGKVRAFVACPSAGVLMHYTALPPDSPLTKAMLEFTQTQATAGGKDFTGHVSFDFLVKSRRGDENSSEDENDVALYPIECNPRVHTAVLLFNNTPELVDEYLSILYTTSAKSFQDQAPLTPKSPQQYYWAGQDLVELVLHPLYRTLFGGKIPFGEVYESFRMFANHVVNWKDGTFDLWDPIPWWWMYHVYWPLQFVQYLFRGRWHKLNVSTGKIFKIT